MRNIALNLLIEGFFMHQNVQIMKKRGNIMKIIEKRCLLPYDLQKFLIEEKLYTVGSNQQLYKLMEYVDKCMDKTTGLTTEDIVNIAINIQNHSKTEYYVTTLCYHINKLCGIIFIDEEELQ